RSRALAAADHTGIESGLPAGIDDVVEVGTGGFVDHPVLSGQFCELDGAGAVFGRLREVVVVSYCETEFVDGQREVVERTGRALDVDEVVNDCDVDGVRENSALGFGWLQLDESRFEIGMILPEVDDELRSNAHGE